ncbi:hypothetical protein Q5P01_006579 [Channa striata]|uniref:Uncharacterized protein n=1 Tax=Channa striata TaxID=64152 RepID=A0AA88NDC2_CHASR|nr:hypothetical protein Q5P01_006579 [Channa striata]
MNRTERPVPSGDVRPNRLSLTEREFPPAEKSAPEWTGCGCGCGRGGVKHWEGAACRRGRQRWAGRIEIATDVQRTSGAREGISPLSANTGNIMGGKLSKKKKGYDVSDPKQAKEESAPASAEKSAKVEDGAPSTEPELTAKTDNVAEKVAGSTVTAVTEAAEAPEKPKSAPSEETEKAAPVQEPVVTTESAPVVKESTVAAEEASPLTKEPSAPTEAATPIAKEPATPTEDTSQDAKEPAAPAEEAAPIAKEPVAPTQEANSAAESAKDQEPEPIPEAVTESETTVEETAVPVAVPVPETVAELVAETPEPEQAHEPEMEQEPEPESVDAPKPDSKPEQTPERELQQSPEPEPEQQAAAAEPATKEVEDIQPEPIIPSPDITASETTEADAAEVSESAAQEVHTENQAEEESSDAAEASSSGGPAEPEAAEPVPEIFISQSVSASEITAESKDGAETSVVPCSEPEVESKLENGDLESDSVKEDVVKAVALPAVNGECKDYTAAQTEECVNGSEKPEDTPSKEPSDFELKKDMNLSGDVQEVSDAVSNMVEGLSSEVTQAV